MTIISPLTYFISSRQSLIHAATEYRSCAGNHGGIRAQWALESLWLTPGSDSSARHEPFPSCRLYWVSFSPVYFRCPLLRKFCRVNCARLYLVHYTLGRHVGHHYGLALGCSPREARSILSVLDRNCFKWNIFHRSREPSINLDKHVSVILKTNITKYRCNRGRKERKKRGPFYPWFRPVGYRYNCRSRS